MQNYYQTLEVAPSASFDQIKAAFRKKALQFHPDRGGTHLQMVRINEAWEVLSNPKLRLQYDESLKTGNINREQFANARKRSENYERDWSKFDSWLSSISRDFTSAKYGSKSFHGMAMPTSSGSISAWVFLIAGGLLGFLLWLAIFVSVTSVWSPKETTTTQSVRKFGLPGSDRYRQKETKRTNPLFARIVMITCLASVACGAWSGKWAHQTFGASITGLLPKNAPFSFFTPEGPTIDNAPAKPHSEGRNQTKASKSCACPGCKQRIRVPDLGKTLQIKCPKCKKRFELPHEPNNPKSKELMKFPPTKASLTTLLRGLVIFEIAFAVIVLSLEIAASSMGEQVLAEAGLVQEYGNLQMFSFAILVVALVILFPMAIAGWFGVFQRKKWGRWLYLVGLVATQLLEVFVGCFSWSYSWDLSAALASISYMVSGVIVAICFLSPLASEFGSSSGNQPI